MKIEDQTILITGGAGNFGSFLCDYFFQRSTKKIILLDLDKEKLHTLSLKFPGIEVYACDLTKIEDVESVAEKIYLENKVSVLINNAGFIHSEPLINIMNRERPFHSVENWNKTIQLNMQTCFNTTAVFASKMVQSRTRGIIINISSIAAKGNLGQTAYSAAKAGIEAMTKTWSKELGIFKIRSVAVAPGFINTESTNESLADAVIDKWKKQIPLGKLGELENIGNAIEFAITNDYFNGKIISVDGGLTI